MACDEPTQNGIEDVDEECRADQGGRIDVGLDEVKAGEITRSAV